jgi:hypothetical protein
VTVTGVIVAAVVAIVLIPFNARGQQIAPDDNSAASPNESALKRLAKGLILKIR